MDKEVQAGGRRQGGVNAPEEGPRPEVFLGSQNKSAGGTEGKRLETGKHGGVVKGRKGIWNHKVITFQRL